MKISAEESSGEEIIVGNEEIVFAAALHHKLCSADDRASSELDVLASTIKRMSDAGVLPLFLAASSLIEGRPSKTTTDNPATIDRLRTLADYMGATIREFRVKGTFSKIVLEPSTLN
jgi:hypothetical protein